jgi:AbrB family looped-hinge helix DNA binding protein
MTVVKAYHMRMAAIDDERVHHMKVTTAGQVSVPAEVRRRWATSRVKITDEGDRLIIEPEPDNPFADLVGVLAGVVDRVAYDELKASERDIETERDRRRYPRIAEEER